MRKKILSKKTLPCTLAALLGIMSIPSMADSVDVVRYTFDEGSGVVATDNSGKGNQGTLHNGPTWVIGKVGSGALSFNGTDQTVSIPSAATAGLRAFGMEFWVKTSETGINAVSWQRPTLIGQATPGPQSGDFGITTNNGYIGFWTGLSSSGDNVYLSTKTKINDNLWHFIKVANDGAKASLTVDNVFEASLATGLPLGAAAFWVGGLNSDESPGHGHQGSIDDLHIYAIKDSAVKPPLKDPTAETTGGWVKYAENPLPTLAYSKFGTIFDITLVKEPTVFKMWVSWRTHECNGYTHSADGITWSDPVCVLNPTNSGWEDRINRPSVINHGGKYHMWYTGQGGGSSRIGYATSLDGLSWVRENGGKAVLTADGGWEKPSVMNPNVSWDEQESIYKMWYCGGEDYEPDAIGYATSKDGITWTKATGNPVFAKDPSNHWESVKVAGPQVIKDPWGPTGTKGYLLFYIGYRTVDSTSIGMAFSKDGLTNWTRYENNPIIRSSKNNGFDASACYKPYALLVGNKWMLWYNGRNEAPEQIALATHDGADLGFPAFATTIKSEAHTFNRSKPLQGGYVGRWMIQSKPVSELGPVPLFNLAGRNVGHGPIANETIP